MDGKTSRESKEFRIAETAVRETAAPFLRDRPPQTGLWLVGWKRRPWNAELVGLTGSVWSVGNLCTQQCSLPSSLPKELWGKLFMERYLFWHCTRKPPKMGDAAGWFRPLGTAETWHAEVMCTAGVCQAEHWNLKRTPSSSNTLPLPCPDSLTQCHW